jgi:hypothetical protein
MIYKRLNVLVTTDNYLPGRLLHPIPCRSNCPRSLPPSVPLFVFGGHCPCVTRARARNLCRSVCRTPTRLPAMAENLAPEKRHSFVHNGEPFLPPPYPPQPAFFVAPHLSDLGFDPHPRHEQGRRCSSGTRRWRRSTCTSSSRRVCQPSYFTATFRLATSRSASAATRHTSTSVFLLKTPCDSVPLNPLDFQTSGCGLTIFWGDFAA